MTVKAVKAVKERVVALLFGLCPSCGCDGLVDHGAGHRECLICGYDSARAGCGPTKPSR